ncbi:class I SAM-dependent DNA methyltransferase [Salinicoccus jeotgali]|uniref:site-specific DNA-methyltransferase (adenine-specific) n=1 Tax=Salinicoccus jeotgali TaxID=381634 RepID=A0ABP7EPT4_9STAP
MSVIELEDMVIDIVNKDNHSNFIYDFLSVYNIPKATITRLKSGNQNLTKRDDEIHLKNRLWYKKTDGNKIFDAFVDVEEEVKELSAKPRYIIVTNFENFLAKDTKTQEALDIDFKDLPQYFEFFLGWMGIEKINFDKENPADIKAAERFARIYDTVKRENEDIVASEGFDIFFMRLLFCMFAEDTDIFKRGSFTNTIKTLTKSDGSDLDYFFHELFDILDKKDRKEVPKHLADFPYVNGQLFSKEHQSIKFSSKSRKLIIECGELLNWTKINPDIFGSMVQAIATNENRSLLGTHYTSVPNIMKVIKPLFLDDLYREFERAYDNVKKLDLLNERLGQIKFFDPACGSGNFLIITYKELRILEIKILLRKRELTENLMYLPSVTLDQFFGIEIDDFAHDAAKLSLWIVEHQMNMELEEIFGYKVRATLPLQSVGDIRCANAIKIEWSEICPVTTGEEVYVFGNPPYRGSKKQSKSQKSDMNTIIGNIKNGKMLDYISAWFLLGAKYSQKTNAKVAFVSTNSITHGEQVSILWNEMFKHNIQINFAYTSFKWENNATNNAGVTVVIIGFNQTNNHKNKVLFTNETQKVVKNINPYLVEGKDILVTSTKKSISNLPRLRFGNMPNDGGGLLFTRTEYLEAINQYNELIPYFKKFKGSVEFINDEPRYCLWLDERKYEEIKDNPIVKDRILITKTHRENSRDTGTNKLALRPWEFRDTHESEQYSIVVPAVSSENRFYIPMGIISADTVISNRAYVIYDGDIFLLGVLMSRMHMTWVKAIGGRLKTDYNYSAGLCYNTFPFPKVSTVRLNKIREATLNILDIREEQGGSLGELYSPETMPNELKNAHIELDDIVDRIYQKREFINDEERLAVLLNLYQEITKV